VWGQRGSENNPVAGIPTALRTRSIAQHLRSQLNSIQVIRLVPTPVDYWICTTFQRERMCRNYFLNRDPEKSLFESYRELARLFPKGLADFPELPEEASGAVKSVWKDRRRAAL
jgi:hypothetical protein